ncbi:MAG: Phosphoribosylformylglycinamidine synthase 1 [Planctomycetes bacterium ADurb.Bin412]|nr:MAG: Phosphoribosylformylglycinamidine synthase 1 [Planctomycetes bacterium ADurb.Bin412]
MLRNRSLKFICNSTNLKVQRTDTAFTNQLLPDEIIKVPIAHGEGNYFCDQPTLAALKRERRILFSYCDANGVESEEANPNGSVANIAGIINEGGNVLGMMPHPERCSEEILSGTDGLGIFTSMLESFQEGKR